MPQQELLLNELIKKKDKKNFKLFLDMIANDECKHFMQADIRLLFIDFCDAQKKANRFRQDSSMADFFSKVQEMITGETNIIVMYRSSPGSFRFYRLRLDCEYIEEISAADFLTLKDSLILGEGKQPAPLRINYLPFYDFFPAVPDVATIGNGIRYLNRYQCSRIFQYPGKWHAKLFDFLKMHRIEGRQIMINSSRFKDMKEVLEALKKMIKVLEKHKVDTPFATVEKKMKREGFEMGWGKSVGQIVETMKRLRLLVHEPVQTNLIEFLSRVPIPLISRIAIISPHGWFAQENVLGMPDTGGQVIYILEQVRSLEKHLTQSLRECGINILPKIIVLTRLIPDSGHTTCNLKKEKIHQTENSWILRVPFRDTNGDIKKKWISRFKIWPYLDNFVEEAATEIRAEFMGRPDLIVGNYSDGNLVATLLSDHFDVIQCNIAHALEKSKYPMADLHWQQNEQDYRFSLQFTADMLAMNKADFIISSTFREIAGTANTLGQYESYMFFTLPGLYQVVNGIDLFSPKFNVIPPGVDEEIYFPYFKKERRIAPKKERWEKRLFQDESEDIYGRLEDQGRSPIFAMSRLDKVKNVTGLIEAFGNSKYLRANCNLVIAGGTNRLEDSHDAEEQEQIKKAYQLIDTYGLENSIRWLPMINKMDTGEVYRIIAERRGIFVQPALFEAFGLTILEAMLSGLPTFGPQAGGPSEIIENGVNGFLLNTAHPRHLARGLEDFFKKIKQEPGYWDTISRAGIKRVKENFNWEKYCTRLIELTKLYGFWRFSVSAEGKVKMNLYSELIYHFLIKQRANF